MEPAIEAVTFDFWNTLARARLGWMGEARQRAVADACAECEVEVESELLAATLEAVTRSYEESWATGTHFHPREGAAMLVEALGVTGAARETVADAFLTAGQGVSLEIAPGIGEVLPALDERGIRVGIVCDVGFTGGAMLRGLLAGRGLLEHFSGWGFSDEVGHYKPAPQIFEAALAMLDAEPARAIHVGDLRRTDVAGAAALGMRTVRYRAFNDDTTSAAVEADFILDRHLELPDLLERVGAAQ